MINVENGALQVAINNAAVGETVVLTSDVTLNSRVTISNVITIDLNGYTISGDIDDSYGAIYVGTKGDLTVVDGSIEKTGSIVNTLGHAIGNYGSVIIYDGTFIGSYALYNFYYNNSVYGTSVIYGGIFKSYDENSLAIANCGDLTINGGAIESIDTTNMLIVTNGDISSLDVGIADYNPTNQSTSIHGGHITTLTVAENSSNNITISGGTFDSTVDTQYLADGFKLTYDKNTGTYMAIASQGFKVIATSASKVRDLVIRDGQLIFIQDLGRIAFDFKGKRVFYNQIVELETEAERQDLESPLNGYYFVIDTAVLWSYQDGWTQITERPQEVVFIGVELPSLGQAGKIYVDVDDKEISIWDEETEQYIQVSNFTEEISVEDVENLFK